MSRYRFVEAESRRYSVTQLCRIAQVSRTAYYEWQDGPPSPRERDDAALTAKIKSKMALDDTISARYIDVDTRDSVVTLSGTVESESQRQRALQLARETEGVVSVVDHLRMR